MSGYSGYNVGDLIAEFLAQIGVPTVVGIVSVHNIPMLDGIGRRNAIRYVMARGEMGGAHMADGFAHASGSLGATFSSTGPGAANAVGGLIEARIAGTPLLHITGHTATNFVDKGMGSVHDVPDQLGMLQSISKTTYRIRHAQQALGAKGRKTVVMTGDGGFFLNVRELWTAVQEKLDLCVIVMNDKGYGVIKNIQDAYYGGPKYFGDLLGPDLGQLAQLAGLPLFKITSADKFGLTVKQALTIAGPTLMEVDMNSIGSYPPYLPYNKRHS